MDESAALKALFWIGSSKQDFRSFPEAVKDEMGYALFRAQQGREHRNAKALKGFGGRAVMELVGNHDGNAFRAVYTVKFNEAVFVLHAFQKKSTKGISTSKQDLELIKTRLRDAETIYHARIANKRK